MFPSHYKTRITPWQFIEANGLDYFEGNVIKYITRYKNKAGLVDLKKAREFIDKLIDRWPKEIDDEKTALTNLLRRIDRTKSREYTQIVTTGRGGMWAAANVAYALGITRISALTHHEVAQLSNETILFVDDIVDTGKTIQSFAIDSASLYCRSSTKTFPTFSGCVIGPQDGYVQLPLSQMMDKEHKETK